MYHLQGREELKFFLQCNGTHKIDFPQDIRTPFSIIFGITFCIIQWLYAKLLPHKSFFCVLFAAQLTFLRVRMLTVKLAFLYKKRGCKIIFLDENMKKFDLIYIYKETFL